MPKPRFHRPPLIRYTWEGFRKMPYLKCFARRSARIRAGESLRCVSESCFLFDYMLFLTCWVCLTQLQLLTPGYSVRLNSNVFAVSIRTPNAARDAMSLNTASNEAPRRSNPLRPSTAYVNGSTYVIARSHEGKDSTG